MGIRKGPRTRPLLFWSSPVLPPEAQPAAAAHPSEHGSNQIGMTVGGEVGGRLVAALVIGVADVAVVVEEGAEIGGAVVDFPVELLDAVAIEVAGEASREVVDQEVVLEAPLAVVGAAALGSYFTVPQEAVVGLAFRDENIDVDTNHTGDATLAVIGVVDLAGDGIEGCGSPAAAAAVGEYSLLDPVAPQGEEALEAVIGGDGVLAGIGSTSVEDAVVIAQAWEAAGAAGLEIERGAGVARNRSWGSAAFLNVIYIQRDRLLEIQSTPVHGADTDCVGGFGFKVW